MLANWRLVSEQRKKRYTRELPILKVLSMQRKNKPYNFEFQKQYPNSSPYYYEVEIQNVKGGIAYLRRIHLWDIFEKTGKTLALLEDKVNVALFTNEKEAFVSYDAPNSNIIPPMIVEVEYQDRFGNVIKYTAKTRMMVAPPTPWLGVRDYIEHSFEFPKNLS